MWWTLWHYKCFQPANWSYLWPLCVGLSHQHSRWQPMNTADQNFHVKEADVNGFCCSWHSTHPSYGSRRKCSCRNQLRRFLHLVMWLCWWCRKGGSWEEPVDWGRARGSVWRYPSPRTAALVLVTWLQETVCMGGRGELGGGWGGTRPHQWGLCCPRHIKLLGHKLPVASCNCISLRFS